MTDVQKIEQVRRVVLLHTQGQFRGLYQIMGTTEDFGGRLPTTTEPFTIRPDTRMNHASLVKVRPRYALYRESDSEAAGGTFDARQR